MTRSLFVGIDLGGTKVATALVDSNGKILASCQAHTFPTSKNKTTVHGLAVHLADQVKSVCTRQQLKSVKGVGLASAGPMNVDQGVLLSPTHFPRWKRAEIVRELQLALRAQGLGCPIGFQNDAMAAALGEGWIGAAKGLRSYALVTLGTGVGSGVIFKGDAAQFAGMGSEWGLGIISLERARDCAWDGSVESFASGTGMLKRARALGFAGDSLKELMQIPPAKRKKFAPIFDDCAFALACLCHNLSLGYHPEAIFFTGGVMNLRKYFWAKLQKDYRKLMQSSPLFITNLKPAKLGFEAGVLGAAFVAKAASKR